MEKQKHVHKVLLRAKEVSIAEHDRIATEGDASATLDQRKQKKGASFVAVRRLVSSVDYAERAGVDFEGGVEK